MTDPNHPVSTALVILIVLQSIMLLSLFAGIAPHPPIATPLFGMAPFIGASISIAMAAIMLGALSSKTGQALCLIAAVLALISFGPHKYLDAQFPQTWPAVITAQAAIAFILIKLASRLTWSRAKQS